MRQLRKGHVYEDRVPWAYEHRANRENISLVMSTLIATPLIGWPRNGALAGAEHKLL